MEAQILDVLAGSANAATVVICFALLDLRQRISKVEEKMLYILTELAKRGVSHNFEER